MTLIQLEYIIAVATYKSFSEAASHCFVTQPTLSMQIHKLEDELGIVIFNRSQHPVEPTEFGEKIIAHARKIVEETNNLKSLVETETGKYAGRLKIGIIPTIAPYLLPRFLNDFVNNHPDVEIIIDELTTNEILAGISKDKIDIGVLALPVHDTSLFDEALYYEPFVAYIPQSSKLHELDKIKISDITIEDLMLLKEGHCLREQTLKLCKSSFKELDGSKTRIFFEGGNLETLIKLVEQDFGSTLLPYLAIDTLKTDKSLSLVKEFEAPVPRRTVGIVYNKHLTKKHLVKALKKEILNSVPESLKTKENSLIIQ